MTKHPQLAVALLAGASVLAIASIASAQNAPAPAAAPAAAPADGAGAVGEIVVTGSRVIQNGNNMPTPVTVVTGQQLLVTRPTTVFEGLLDLPVFAGSLQAVGNPAGAGGSSRTESALNLRALGPTRTLILYDGHRLSPTTQDGVVDASTIPQQLLQRVDVVTGGVSAVYGSDGVGGVANFITDRKFTGIKMNLQTGVAQFGGDHSNDESLAVGTNLFEGRGHFEASFENRWEQGVDRLERDFLKGQASLQGTGTAASPFQFVYGALQAAYSYGGKIIGPANNPLLNYSFDANGVATPFINGISNGFGQNIQIGGDGTVDQGSSLKSQLDSRQSFARFDYDLTENVHYFLTGNYTEQHQNSGNTNFGNSSLTIPVTNAFLSPAIQQAMMAKGITSFTLAKYWDDNVVPAKTADFFNKSTYVNTGIEATLGKYKFEGSYTYSLAHLDSRSNESTDYGKLYAALDAVVNPANGQIVCNVTLTNPGLYPGCVPINIFGPTADKSTIESVITRRSYHGINTMNDASGSLAGAPFSTWAGPVELAASAEWRKLSYSLFSDGPDAATAPLNCTGLRYGCIAGTSTEYSDASSQRPPVFQDVTEGALEMDAPLVKDHLIDSLSFNAGVRETHYNVSGAISETGVGVTSNKFDALTWKFGLDMEVNSMLTVRATRSQDIRAPNLNELYQPSTLTNTVRLDVLTNQSTRADQIASGNPNLTPEVSHTWTLGAVIRPLQNLSLTVDAYDIQIDNAIQTITGYSAVYQQACLNSGGTSFYCTLLTRPLGYSNTSPANTLTKILSEPLNIAKEITYGIDFEANYKTDLFGRALSIRSLVTYQPHHNLYQPGAVTTETAGVSIPIWRLTTYFHYALTDQLSMDALEKWRSELQNADPRLFVFRSDADRIVKSVAFTNLTFTYRFKSESKLQKEMFINISDIFDTVPPPAALGNAGTQSNPGRSDGFYYGDDPMGRAFVVGLRLRH